MRTNYIIKYQREGEEVSNTYTSATTKREIESMFNRLMRSFRKDTNYSVEDINMGYSKVTFYGTFGISETEYWIARA